MRQMDNTEDLINRGVSLAIRVPKFKFFTFYLFASPEFQLMILFDTSFDIGIMSSLEIN